MSDLPPGFVIDGEQHVAPPPGFVIDGEAPATPVTAAGLGAAAVGGLGRGATELAGLPADLGDLLNRGINKGLDAVGIGAAPLAPNVAGSQNIQKQVEKVTGEFHKPQNTAEKYVDTAASFVPGAVAAPGGIVSNAVRYGILPGLASEAAGQATEGTTYEPYARAVAGVGAGIVNPARAITPLPATAARQAAVDALQREGVTSLTAGQRTGNTSLRYLEDAASTAPGAGHGAATMEAAGQHQFTDATLRRAGAAGEATPEVLAANQQRLGQSFDDLSARNTLVPDNRFINDLTGNVADYRNVPASQQRQIVQGYIDDIVGHVNNGHMPGEAYQEMRSRLGRQSDAYRNNDPALSQALGGMQTSLDNAMRRSMSPADVEAWDTARRQYAAQKTIETAASRAGGVTAEGQITPANLRNTVATQNRGGYARGEGQFNELARSGVQVMTPLPNSGTAQRTNAFHLLNAGLLGIPQALAGRAVMSAPVQSYLANQLMTRALPANPTARNLLIVKMLQQSQQPADQSQ